ncbi:MAG: hydrolase [Planctomycetes bacterium]|nr:hydrolase [Planctomycetota bacterium]
MTFGAPLAPHRHEFVLRRDRAVLVIVDVQERLLAEVARRDAVAANVVKLARAAAVLGLPVVVTEHAAKVFGPTAESVRREIPAAAIQKTVFSCFGVEEFRERVKSIGRAQLVVAGLETHICVCQTALDAIAQGYSVHVARDACSARGESDHAAGIEKMSAAGAVPSTTEMAIFELLERAGTAEFRALLPLIKARS